MIHPNVPTHIDKIMANQQTSEIQHAQMYNIVKHRFCTCACMRPNIPSIFTLINMQLCTRMHVSLFGHDDACVILCVCADVTVTFVFVCLWTCVTPTMKTDLYRWTRTCSQNKRRCMHHRMCIWAHNWRFELPHPTFTQTSKPCNLRLTVSSFQVDKGAMRHLAQHRRQLHVASIDGI